MIHRWVLVLFVACIATGQTLGKEPQRASPILLLFERPVSYPQFGIFRDDCQPPSQQFIEQHWSKLKGPNGKDMGFQVLAYNVASKGSYNGAALRLDQMDLRPFRNGELVFWLRRLDPVADRIQRTVKVGGPDYACTRTWKVELKSQSAAGQVVTSGLGVQVTDQQIAQQARQGYFEMRLPLKDFGLDLAKCREITLVFENTRISAGSQRGALGLHAAVLTTHRGESVDNLLYSPESILDELGRKVFMWCEQYARHPRTGLVLDRSPNRESPPPEPDREAMASISATGMSLSLSPEWVRLGYLTRDQARQRTEETLLFVLQMEHKDGLLPHFVDWSTGKRWQQSEYSLLDMGIFLHGCMISATFFGPPISTHVEALLERVDWPRFLTTRTDGKKFLALAWTPERGLTGACDCRSTEVLLAYIGPLGSRAHPIDVETWYNTKVAYAKVGNQLILNPDHPLFSSYYGLLWHDLKGLVDRDGVDFHANATAAALGNREVCRRAGEKFPTYSLKNGGWFGLSAGDSPTRGYIAPVPQPQDAQFLVFPTAALAALPYIPLEIKQDLRRWRTSPPWHDVYGPYGLATFRLGPNAWQAPDVIGIDLQAYAISLANHRKRSIWDLCNRHATVQAALQQLALRKK